MSDEAEPAKTTCDPTVAASAARRPSEVATLVLAVSVAVALGVACGVWINSLMASASASRAARARVPPDIPPPAGETGTLQGSTETADTPAVVKEPAVALVEGRTLKHAPPHVAREASPQPKEEARPAATPEVEEAAAPQREQSQAAPCALYASASSLNIRRGGAAFLVVGGPGETGPVTVSTPSWADIAVFQEGQAAGRNGWMRYTVKSTSKRPGLYTVHFATRCGSQTIPVTVR